MSAELFSGEFPAAFATAFATLFVMVDPIGLAPMFAALTAGATLRQRAVIGGRGVAVAFILLAFFGLIGDEALNAVGVSLPAFRIAGGLMLFLLAVEMLFERRAERREKATEGEDRADPSVFPLATPLIAGPGALAAMILLTADQAGDATGQLAVYAGAAAVLAIAFVVFLATELIERLLGPTGIKVLTRLFGMILGALAVQFVLDGLAAFPAFAN
ncbi:MAG: MarC family protein [Pseudomonadota bacterium]